LNFKTLLAYARLMIRTTLVLSIFALATVCAFSEFTSAQGLKDPATTMTTPGVPGTGMLSQADVAKLNKAAANQTAQAKARAKVETTQLARSINLACDITDAELVGGGKIKQDGKLVDLKLYEISCGGGMGYFLESREPQSPIAISCFAADATHAADTERGVKSDFFCQLPANKDVKVMAASLMTVAGTACTVDKIRWFGVTDSGRTEYSEVACADDKGYFLKIARADPTAQTTVLSCQEAAQRGLKCRLTDGGPVAASMSKQALLDAVKRNGVECEPAQMRIIGRESESKRYVVELQCPQQPKGLIAFVPLEGNTNKFEALDCRAAAREDIPCQLTK
jgi:hypothetical protein